MTPLEILYNGVVERGGKIMQKGKISNGVTRRKFIQKLIKAGPHSYCVLGIAYCVYGIASLFSRNTHHARRTTKFVWALRLKKYPGSLSGPAGLRDVSKQSKWSG